MALEKLLNRHMPWSAANAYQFSLSLGAVDYVNANNWRRHIQKMKKEKGEHWLVVGLVLFCFLNHNHLESKRNNQTWKALEVLWFGFKFIVLVTHEYERDRTKKNTKIILSSLFFLYVSASKPENRIAVPVTQILSSIHKAHCEPWCCDICVYCIDISDASQSIPNRPTEAFKSFLSIDQTKLSSGWEVKMLFAA